MSDNRADPADFQGLIVPMVTPFTATNTIDEKMFQQHLTFLAQHGVSRILLNGTNGEFYALLPEERMRLLDLARKHFSGLILFQAGAESLLQTQKQVAWGQDHGADAIIVLAPFYFADLPQQGLIDYFKTLSKDLTVPFLLYNFPRHTGNKLTAEILAQVEHFGVKDSDPDFSLTAATPHYYIGSDPRILEAYRAGAYGFVSGLSNCLPGPYVAMEEAFKQGDAAAVERCQETIWAICQGLAGKNEIARIKYGLSLQVPGYPTRVRLPFVGLDQAEITAVNETITEFRN